MRKTDGGFSLRHGQKARVFTEVIQEEFTRFAAALWRRELDDEKPPSLMLQLTCTGRRLFYGA
jgi:hypothetical protein